MVYELKVKVLDNDFPAERVLHVRKETSFRQLHHILQTVFDWYGGHAHIFSMHSSDKQFRMIGNTKINNAPFLEQEHLESSLPVLDERKEQLTDWLTSPGDQVAYQYNPKQNWMHTVELKRVLEPEESVLYPICVEAVYLSPLDTPFTDGVKQDSPRHVDSQEDLVDIINEALTRSLPILSSDETEDDDQMWERLFQLASAYYEEKPWKHLSNNQFFVLLDPETETKLFCSISGMDGEDPGLNVYIGEESFAHLLDSSVLLEETSDAVKTAHALTQMEALGLLFKKEEELDKEDVYLLNSHSTEFGNRSALPMFSSISPDHSIPTQLNREEVRLMILAAEQALSILGEVKQGLELPVIQDSSVMLARIFSPEYNRFINSELKIVINH